MLSIPHFEMMSGIVPMRAEDGGAALTFKYTGSPLSDPRYGASLWRFWRTLPIVDPASAVTLGEGNTPLIASRSFAGMRVFWKDETRNPTGSHKDRALSVAATHALETGSRVMAVVSAGSTGLSNAAYAARAGLASVTLTTRGAPHDRLYPAFALGSRIIEVDASIDTLIEMLRGMSGLCGLYVASTTRSSNPHQAEAGKTIAYEIVEQLGDAPDWMVVPVGGGGTIAGIFRGFRELLLAQTIKSMPRLVAVVPKSYDALAVAFERGMADPDAFAALTYRDDVPTVLTKLSHAHPPDGLEALAAIRASNGVVVALTDAAAIDAVGRVGKADGLYLEPSAAIAASAIDALIANSTFRPGTTIVALACGSGFRETMAISRAQPLRIETARVADLAHAIF